MAKAVCCMCGKDKDMRGGKICEKGHFVCVDHIHSWMPGPSRKKCPLDGTNLK